MNTISNERLAELAAAVLDRTAFISAEAVEDAAPVPLDRVARIAYTGPHHGHVTLHTTHGFLAVLAANLLGVDQDDANAGAYVDDALGELANMIGGSVLADLGGESCAFAIGLPELMSTGTPTPEGAAGVCCLDCEGHPLVVAWRPAPAAANAA